MSRLRHIPRPPKGPEPGVKPAPEGEWKGGLPPVGPDVSVTVTFRNGRTATRPAGSLQWHQTGSGGDVVEWARA